jgi:hypothetical protein
MSSGERVVQMKRQWIAGVGAAAVLVCALSLTSPRAAALGADLPAKLSDQEYWKLINDFSEANGYFRSDNLLSNEIWFQYIIPELVGYLKPGGVYLGVGPEQNFTYIAALKPRMVFIIDVRRGNLHTQMMYKALFELSNDRADFVSMLFSRKRPDGLTATSTVHEIFSKVGAVPRSEETYKANYQKLIDHLTRKRNLPLPKEDLDGIDYVYGNFYTYGPSITYNSSQGGGGRGSMSTYATLMTAADGAGQSRSYLANETLFGVMKDLESKNLVVPLVGDFAGPKAIRSVGKYLKEQGVTVTAFYLSNVEQYLGQNGVWQSFCNNVASLPLTDQSTFIYSQNGGGGGGGGLSSWYRPMLADVKTYNCAAGQR